MANGRLAQGTLTQNVQETIYTVGSGDSRGYAVIKLQMLNTGTTDANIRIALHDGTITNADYIEYDVPLVPKGYIERSGIVLGAGQSVALWCTNSSDVSFTLTGAQVAVVDTP